MFVVYYESLLNVFASEIKLARYLCIGELYQLPSSKPNMSKRSSIPNSSTRLVLRMHTQCNSTQNQNQAQPCLLGDDFAFDIPLPKHREQKRTRIGQRHSKRKLCPVDKLAYRNHSSSVLNQRHTVLPHKQEKPHTPRQINHQRNRVPRRPEQIHNSPKDRHSLRP